MKGSLQNLIFCLQSLTHLHATQQYVSGDK